MKFWGGSSFLDAVVNPAGWLHGNQYKKEQKEAEAATAAAREQAEVAKAQLKAEQEAQTLRAEQAAMEASQGSTSGVTEVGSSIDALAPLRPKRRRGADITVGL